VAYALVFGAVDAAVLVPVKSFHAAKRRLAGWLPPEERERLARWMAERVLAAAAPLPVFVACDDERVAEWAEAHGAQVSWGPGLGLNGAIDHGVDTMSGKGVDHVIVAHGDLPLARALADLARREHVVIVPDRRRDGTNVLSRPTAIAIRAEYGAGSFARHLAAALASGAPVTVRLDARLAVDVDTIADFRHPEVAPLLRSAGTVLPGEHAS
jgi:2-phospho-L-lactate/phosphoenolpyruvate guanylyltransferase